MGPQFGWGWEMCAMAYRRRNPALRGLIFSPISATERPPSGCLFVCR
jgi:hypothetical protein